MCRICASRGLYLNMCHKQHVRSTLHERSSEAPRIDVLKMIRVQLYDHMQDKYSVKATRRPCNGVLRYNRPHPPAVPRTLCVTWTARHGPHVTQVQAALRCAEGTYSCCKVLLSVFQIRSLPSCAQSARNCCDLGLNAQGSAARPPSAAILPFRVRPSAPRETRVRENSKARKRSRAGAAETLIGPAGVCGRAFIVFNQSQTDAEVSCSNFVI